MCRLFKSQDPASYVSETRPMRLHGHCTSVRLEAAFWSILEEIAGHEGVSVARFCVILHDEIADRDGEVTNFASMLRVTCLHYLRHQDSYLREVDVSDPALEKVAPLYQATT